MSDYTLLFDSATPEASLGLLRDARLLLARAPTGGRHSHSLARAAIALLEEADVPPARLTRLAFVAGPGSFTSLRVAASTLNGLNTALRLPVVHLSSLMVAAWAHDATKPVWVVEDARAGACFCACYHGAKIVCADACLPLAALPRMDAYTGSRPLPDLLSGVRYLPPARSRAQAAAEMLARDQGDCQRWAEPRYLQRSQAERMEESK